MSGLALDGVAAAVVTHRRPRLAGDTVRRLVEAEGMDPARVVVVVNGPGGLDDPELERRIRMVRLEQNLGPAGGFRRALAEAAALPDTSWIYLCEDDMTLLGLPAPRLAEVVARAEARRDGGAAVGAVVAFGRRFVARSGHTVTVVPRPDTPQWLAPVDVSTWGATLVARSVVDAGVWPDDELFFGFEDFDFYCRVRQAGFEVLVDVPSARKVAHLQTLAGRDAALAPQRPVDEEEPWRAYYFARNFFELARRHGRPSWIAWHLLYSLRRLQLAGSGPERGAIVHGLVDGARGVLGSNPRYLRTVGEHDTSRPGPAADRAGTAPGDAGTAPADAGTTPGNAGTAPKATMGRGTSGALAPGASRRRDPRATPPVTTLILTHNAPASLERCLAAVAGQSATPDTVVVVDNASDPPVEENVRVGPPLAVVRSAVNDGPAGGWARALEAFLDGPGELAWMLDDDMVPDPDCLELLLGAVAGDPKEAFAYPWSVQPDGQAGVWSSWCGVLLSRHIVERVGLPRAELFWWAEDTEYLQWRIPRAGFTPRIVGEALVQHDAVRQGDPRPTWKYYYEARNMLWLHLHVMRRVGWYPRNVTKLVARAAWREPGRRAASLAAVGRGLLDGGRGRLGMTYPVDPLREGPIVGARS